MAYGYTLNGVEIPSDVTEINYSILGSVDIQASGTVTGNVSDGFTDGTVTLSLTSTGGDMYNVEITNANYTETETGKTATIRLYLPAVPTQSFKEAVGMVTAAINLTMPVELMTLITTEATPYFPDIITADGKLCSIPVITWLRKDATDKNAFNALYSGINSIANNTNIAAYCDGNIITWRRFGLYGEISFDQTTRISDYPLKFSYDFAAMRVTQYEDPLEIEIRMRAMLITELSI